MSDWLPAGWRSPETNGGFIPGRSPSGSMKPWATFPAGSSAPTGPSAASPTCVSGWKVWPTVAASAPCRWWSSATRRSPSDAGVGAKRSSPVSGTSRFRRWSRRHARYRHRPCRRLRSSLLPAGLRRRFLRSDACSLCPSAADHRRGLCAAGDRNDLSAGPRCADGHDRDRGRRRPLRRVRWLDLTFLEFASARQSREAVGAPLFAADAVMDEEQAGRIILASSPRAAAHSSGPNRRSASQPRSKLLSAT